MRGGDKEAVQQERLLNSALRRLEEGLPARSVEVEEEDQRAWQMLQLLTSKPVLYVCNVEENSSATGNSHSGKSCSNGGIARCWCSNYKCTN